MCAQHQLLGVPAGGQRLVLLRRAKVRSTSRPKTETRSFPWLQGKKKSIYFSNVHFNFLKIG